MDSQIRLQLRQVSQGVFYTMVVLKFLFEFIYFVNKFLSNAFPKELVKKLILFAMIKSKIWIQSVLMSK